MIRLRAEHILSIAVSSFCRGGGGYAYAVCCRQTCGLLTALWPSGPHNCRTPHLNFVPGGYSDPHFFHVIRLHFIGNMDPVSITLGVAPLCVAGLKGLKRLKEKIKLIHDYEGEIRRFRTKFKTQVSILRDESQLLLQDTGVPRGLAAKMIHDYSHERWMAEDLEQSIKDYLGEKYTEVKEVNKHIGGEIGKIERHLGRLETEESGPSRVSPANPTPFNEIISDDIEDPNAG